MSSIERNNRSTDIKLPVISKNLTSQNHIKNIRSDKNSMENKDLLRVLYLNARSLRNKISEFKALISNENFDIIAITESWTKFSGNDYRGEYEISGYKLFHKERTHKRGGGILLYCKYFMNTEETLINTENELEILSTNILTALGAINFVVVYRPPTQSINLDSEMYSALSQIVQRHEAIIVGDFNCADIHNFRTSNRDSSNLIDFIEDNFLFQKVNEPTRENNILDLVLTTSDDLVTDLKVCEHLANSDHNMIKFDINIDKREIENNLLVPNFNRANFDGFKNELRTINWKLLFKSHNVGNQWKIFKDTFN